MACYPFVVYFSIDRIGPGALGIILITMLVARGALLKQLSPRIMWVSLVLVALLAVLLLTDGTGLVLKLYPTLVNIGLGCACAYTLINPPSMIERIARASGKPLSIKAPMYTRVVTMVWCLFFTLNATMSAFTALFGSIGVWALYNGAIAYALAGTLIIGEMIFRYFYKRRHGLLPDQS